MAHGARDHQKEKEIVAPEVMYRTDSVCHSSIHSVCVAFESYSAVEESGSTLHVPRTKRMEQCETEWKAKQLWLREAKVPELVTFLKQVPWSAFDTESQSRPFPRDPENRATLKPAYVVFGCYMHGGVVGVTQVTRRYPYLTRVVMMVMRSLCDEFQGTSVCVSCNIRSPPHRDSYNLSGSENVVVALIRPCDGGGVWTQLKDEGSSSGQQISVQCGSQEVLGTIQALESPVKLCPQRWHATQPWTGDRLVMIGYSIGSAHKLQMSDRAMLRRYGTPCLLGFVSHNIEVFRR